ncbi:TIGR04282 family arsenosugar biosynthesis glycosyltransferase [Litoribacillus peritrichatus]|uniref:TIGR04282 family arsenosugar biosynthesis glycosyltransferase n=1 Tax=Litoribacillus peritrichatus TaxID=718191 RepID=A0ABP7M272_9GAMM
MKAHNISNSQDVAAKVAVLVFSKAPKLGQVKTRLATTIGELNALNTYQAMLTVIVNRLARLDDIDLYLSAANELDHAFFTDLSCRYGVSGHLQSEGDLGVKMANAIDSMLVHYDKVVIVGGDALSITEQSIREVVIQLSNNDLAIIPSEDGGYVTIGASKTCSNIFNDIDWGTERVFDQQVKRINDNGFKAWIGEPLWDLDEYQDLERVYQCSELLAEMTHHGFTVEPLA